MATSLAPHAATSTSTSTTSTLDLNNSGGTTTTTISSSSSSSHHHGRRHHHRPYIPTKGTGAISKLVGRLRSSSSPGTNSSSSSSDHSSSSHTTTPASSTASVAHGTTTTCSSTDESADASRPRMRTPGIKLLSHGPKTRSLSPDAGAGRHPKNNNSHRRNNSNLQYSARDAPLSLELWNEAYDGLRDNPRSAGLVVAYEAIITQELPDQLKIGGLNMTLRDHPDHRRLDLVTAIADASLKRRRNSKSSQVGDDSRTVVNACKDAVDHALHTYPSAALAWCGLCTLTPLLLDPIMHRSGMRSGILHITGRILWYTHLTRLLQAPGWADEAQFRAAHAQTRDSIAKLYRKVLELEMVCVCAAASAWNLAAKNVVDWQGLGALTGAIDELDEELRGVVDRCAVGVLRAALLADFHDLDVGDAGAAEKDGDHGDA